jgi:hypothetical protein
LLKLSTIFEVQWHVIAKQAIACRIINIPQASDFYVEPAAVSARSTSGALMRSLNALSPFFIKANHND